MTNFYSFTFDGRHGHLVNFSLIAAVFWTINEFRLNENSDYASSNVIIKGSY